MPKNKRVADYIFSDQMIEIMLRQGIAKDKKFGLPQCDSAYGVEPDSVDMIAPIVLPDGAKHPVKGTWAIRYRLLRCGETKVYNTVFVASGNANDAPAAHNYFAGASNADTQLIRDAMPYALTTAKVQSELPDCADVDMFDMVVSEPPHQVVKGGVTYEGVWKESWRFLLCGRMSDVVLHFTPDAKGGGTKILVEPPRR